MDREFIRVVLTVAAIGLFIGAIGATALYIAFRAYGSDKPHQARGAIWIAALLLFIIAGCLVLLRLSLAGR